VSLLFWTSQYAALHGNFHRTVHIELPTCDFIIPIREEGHQAFSPGRGTFGGFMPSIDSFLKIDDYRRAYRSFFREIACETLTVSLPPEYLKFNIFKPQKELMAQGTTLFVDSNYHIELSSWTEQSLGKGERKKLRQAREVGFSFVDKLDRTNLELCIQLLIESRSRLGVKLSMSSEEIIKAIELLPESYRMVAVYKDNIIVAAALLVRIDDLVEYVLYWGDSLEFRSFSPTVFLCTKIIEGLKYGDISILDLGISSLRGKENSGLSRFKSNLGAIRTDKACYLVGRSVFL